MAQLVVAAVITVCFVIFCRTALKKRPWVFYLISLGFVALYCLIQYGLLRSSFLLWIVAVPIQRCYYAFFLFAVVMFIGVFSENSWVRQELGPVRAELSLVASLLCAAHVVRYALTYITSLFGGLPHNFLATSLLVAFIMTLLLMLLAVTSVKTVKKRMHTVTWKNIQRAAYVFFALILVHICFALGPAALSGSSMVQMRLLVYSIVVVSYLVLRLCRGVFDANKCREPIPERF